MLLDDHVLFAECLDLVLTANGFTVDKPALPDNPGRSAGLLARVCRIRPEIVVLDLDLGPFGDGARLITPIARNGTQVVVVSADMDPARWGECLHYGARKVIGKTAPLNELVSTLRRISEGLRVLGPGEREALLKTWHDHRVNELAARVRLDQLTARESEVLGHLTHGRTVRDIATLSVVCEATVRTQVKSILSKLGVNSQIAAVGMANHLHWRSPVD